MPRDLAGIPGAGNRDSPLWDRAPQLPPDAAPVVGVPTGARPVSPGAAPPPAPRTHPPNATRPRARWRFLLPLTSRQRPPAARAFTRAARGDTSKGPDRVGRGPS
ncbi:hypothetical protein GCM10009663_39660 [Kitasatospora arboriphila]|uniref:Uncharacterized protein n=1 Tax=Kitasatospora arboriphila TaxID=258052 RepID=A0ABN1TKR2_9ACTN